MGENEVNFSPYTTVAAEGARIALHTCLRCGAAVMHDPREPDSALELHANWHHQQEGVPDVSS